MSLFSAQAYINWTLYVLSHAPANSGWRSDGQILDLKQHVHGVVKLDSLTVGQAKHLVVIQNSVHVFDPQSVYRSVTHNPLVIFSGVLSGDSQKRSLWSLSSDVLEQRTSTGSGLFALLSRDIEHIFG